MRDLGMKGSMIAVIVGGIAFLILGPAAMATSTFDVDAEGWRGQYMYYVTDSRYAGGGYDSTTTPAPITASTTQYKYSATGGNTGGYICDTAGGSVLPRPYHIGKHGAVWLGDLTGQTIGADFMRTGADWRTVHGSTGTDAPTLRWIISDDTAATGDEWSTTWYVSKAAVSIEVNDLTGAWTPQSIEMTADNFMIWPWGLQPSQTGFRSFSSMLGNYNLLGLTLYHNEDTGFGWEYPNHLPAYGAYSAGSGSTLGMDNFDIIVPEPATLALLGLGILGLAGLRRR